jgi:predicted metal-dependent HD superfamily phosphohydrolase
MIDFPKAKLYIIHLLDTHLSSEFLYHDIAHTKDVYESVTRLAELAKVSGHDLMLLQTAAMYHDAGLMEVIDDHEDKGVELIRKVLPDFGYSNEDIDAIARMVMSTKLPQSPKDKLSELLCDADLDYLGRDDFFLRGAKLHLEWKRMNIADIQFNEWIVLQRTFLKSHGFFSDAAKKLRDKGKMENLKQLENICNTN